MAFIAAAEIRLRKVRLPAAAREEMLRSWPVMLLVAIATMVVFIRSFDLPLLALLPFERLPHLRESIFATQPFLFLLLNSMIFAVLAPSGLFNDSCCSSSSVDELPSSLSRSSSSTLDSRSDSPIERKSTTNPDDQALDEPPQQQDNGAPEPMPEPIPVATDLSESTPGISDPAPPEKEIVRKSPRASNVSPPKARVKRIKKMQKSASSSQVAARQITAVTGIVVSDQGDSSADPTDSLKDEDFKHFIDSFIAHTRHQMLLQEWEYESQRRTI